MLKLKGNTFDRRAVGVSSAIVFVRVEPLPHPDLEAIAELTKKKSTNKYDAELNLLFKDEIVGGVVPKEYIGPVYQGIREAMSSGVLAGYEMNGVCGGPYRRLLSRS